MKENKLSKNILIRTNLVYYSHYEQNEGYNELMNIYPTLNKQLLNNILLYFLKLSTNIT